MRDERFMQPPQGLSARVADRRGDRRRVSTCGGRWFTQQWSRLAEAASVPALRTSVCAFAGRAGVEPAVVESLRLAVSEALTNAVEHAYRGIEPRGNVAVSATVSDDRVQIVVADHGVGFAPRLDSPGLGFGLPVIANLCDSLEILAATPSGTELHMAFNR